MTPPGGYRRTYGRTRTSGGPNAARETNQAPISPAPPSNAYRPGWCANGHAGDVAPTQLDAGGPTYPICRRCNTEAAVYRDEFRGCRVDAEGTDDDFRLAVTRAFRRTVPAEARGPRWFLAPRHAAVTGGKP